MGTSHWEWPREIGGVACHSGLTHVVREELWQLKEVDRQWRGLGNNTQFPPFPRDTLHQPGPE